MEDNPMNQTTDPTAPAANQPSGGPPPNPASGNPVIPPTAGPAGATLGTPTPILLSAGYLAEKLEEAELLLGYAAEVGIRVDNQVRDDVLKVRSASAGGRIPEPLAANLLSALTTLAMTVRPVTVESLQAWANPKDAETKKIPLLAPIAIFVGCVIVIFSLLTFISKSIADKITVNIDAANELAAKLRTELGPSPLSTNQPSAAIDAMTNSSGVSWSDQVWFGPAGPPTGVSDKDVVTDLQQFAATMRAVDGYARQLKRCLFDFSTPHYVERTTNRMILELTPGLNVRLAQELTDRVAEYQQVRSLGSQVVEKITVYYGAIAISILPVLYALLGAVAYLLRSYEQQSKNRTLVAGEKPIARLLIAGIGGLVVGQFNNVGQGINITPFAVAFLVGYAVDVFFTFLEGLLQMFIKRGPGNS